MTNTLRITIVTPLGLPPASSHATRHNSNNFGNALAAHSVRTQDFQIKNLKLYQLSYGVNLVASTGLEPVIFALKERRVDQLLYNAICRVYGS